MSRTLQQCPLCDSKRVEVRYDHSQRYKYLGIVRVCEGLEHAVCLDCELDFFLPGQIDRNNERFLVFAKRLVKHIAPWEILAIREKYDISQEQANRIFQCGSTTQFSKWERGEVAPTGTAAIALREALDNPDFMRRMASKAGISVNIPAPAHTRVVGHGVGATIAGANEIEAMDLLVQMAGKPHIHWRAASRQAPWVSARDLPLPWPGLSVHPEPAQVQ
jgi:putative zinc finger/helix-turn-helix YgiT family protein